MADIVISIGVEIAKCLVGPILRRARYLFCFKQFVGDVEKAKQELEGELADVNKRKEEADRKTEEIMPSVKKWLDDVNAIFEDVQKLQQEIEGRGNKCFNVSLRYSLAKQMEDKAKQMMGLKNNSRFEPFSQLSQLPGITYFSSKEFLDFNSRKSAYNRLLEAIKDDKNKMVGLYGMGGSGKTTLTKEVGKKVDELKLFENVVFAVVSKSPNVHNIQQEIAEQISLKFEETSQLTRAQRLSLGFKNKRILIILDDVWSKLSLEQIGIPLNEGCCVLLTTRLRRVCLDMDCESIIELSILTDEDSWALFKMHANPTNVSHNEFDSIGRKIVDECKGLPIAIVTVGSTLKRRGVQVWESTLQKLQRPLPLDVEDDFKTPYAILEVSYDNLPSPLAQSLFLMCSIFPEDHEIHIEDLIRFGKGTFKLGDNIYTMEDARNEILITIEKLLDSCLLMHTDKQACVKLHDVVRDVALWIAKKKCQAILVDNHAVSRMFVENESLKETKVISLWNSENNFELSNQLCCPTLEILLLHPKRFIGELRGIEELKVLILVTSSFRWLFWNWETLIQRSMQQSIVSTLINLHTLCFRRIALGDISFLCQLKRLEILDLRGSQFDELPAEIVYMKKLKLLDVFACSIEKSPLEVIGKCEQLDELYFWDGKSVITENFCLSGLKRYVIYDSTFGSQAGFSVHLHFLKYYDDCIEALRALCIQGFKVSTLNSSMKNLILRANCLWLKNCWWDHNNISYEIKHLGVSHCQDKRFIVDNLGTNFPQTGQVFSHLITLRLEQMDSLEQMFQDSSIRCSLPKLQELYMERCPNLTTILTHATVISIPDLRKLEISSCKKVKWLFSYSLTFHCPSLVELRIRDCLELESLIGEEIALGDRLLQDMQDYPCGNETERAFLVVTAKSFKQLQNHEALTLFLRLEHVEIVGSIKRKKCLFEVQVRGTVESEESIEAQEPLKLNSELCSLTLYFLKELEYIWNGPTQSVSLHRLERVILKGCPKLRNIFAFAIVTSLPELRELQVSECEEWEGIFCEESFKNFSSSSSSNVCFPKLQQIWIRDCNKVKRLFLYSLASHCPSLEKLNINNCFEFESLDGEAAYEDILLLLLKLKTLTLKRLPKLREIFGGRFEHKLESFHNKQKCSPHKHKNERVEVKILELISIELQGLPELDYIWKGPTQFVSLHRLEDVTLMQCSRLKHIFTLVIVTSLPELMEIYVNACEEWEGIFCEESLQNLSSSSNVCFPRLQNIDIRNCNKVKRLFSYSLASHCPSLEKITICNCSKLESLDEEASHEDILVLHLKLKHLNLWDLPKLREIFKGRFEHKLESLQCSPHKHKNDRVKVVNLELISINLQDLPKWEYIWKGPTQFVNLHRLEDVTLRECSRLKHIFTLVIVTSLPELRSIIVYGCQEWEGIFCEESLKNISSSIVCLPRLKRICICDCNKVRRLFSYALASHCPSLEEITIWDCSQLEGVVLAYEGEVAYHHEKLFLNMNDLYLENLPKLREIYPGYEFNHLSGTIQIQDCPNICNISL